MISRRSFATLLGLSPVAAPLAAKAAVDKEIASLVGLSGAIAPTAEYGNGAFGPSAIGGNEYLKIRIAAAEYAKLMGLPEFVRENMRRSSGYVSALDPDLAAKRSWSMSVKILTQRERNLERQIEAVQHGAWHSRASMTFKTLTGWEWPW